MDPAAEVLRRFYEAEETYMSSDHPDFAVIARTLHPACAIFQPASLPYGGAWHGHEGFERWLRKFGAAWSALSVQDSRVFPTGDGETVFSMSHVHAIARATGKPADWPLLQYFKVRDGLILELRPFHWDTASMLPALDGGPPS